MVKNEQIDEEIDEGTMDAIYQATGMLQVAQKAMIALGRLKETFDYFSIDGARTGTITLTFNNAVSNQQPRPIEIVVTPKVIWVDGYQVDAARRGEGGNICRLTDDQRVLALIRKTTRLLKLRTNGITFPHLAGGTVTPHL